MVFEKIRRKRGGTGLDQTIDHPGGFVPAVGKPVRSPVEVVHLHIQTGTRPLNPDDHGHVFRDGVLPVELNGFTAVARDGEVALAWSTASEANVDRFEIVRDGSTLAQIPAANSATGSNYNWTDVTVVNGTTYSYELVLVNLDGSRENIATESATPTLGSGVVNEFALHQNYPNPFNPENSIAFSLPEV